MKSIVTTVSKLLIVPMMVLGLATFTLAPSAYAQSTDDGTDDTTEATRTCNTNSTNIGVKTGSRCASSDDQRGNLGNVIEIVTNVLLFIIGAVAVIMIIIGGFRYVTSNGDSSQLTAAKNTILYSVVGLIVALLAFAIVRFITNSFVAPTPTGADGRAVSLIERRNA